MAEDLDLISKLGPEARSRREHGMRCISPDDAKYGETSQALVPYLSAHAEWMMCAEVQRILLETRMEFGQAEQRHVDEVAAAMKKISPLNISMIEDEITRHDQLAVIEEIGRYVSPETKALLHPGTTSYCILDTARAYNYRKAWADVIRPAVVKSIDMLCRKAEQSFKEKEGHIQAGRTHLQTTSPVFFGGVLAGYAARLARRLEKCDSCFDELRGKVSGIVGTGASIDMVIGEGRSLGFEKAVLKKLGLEPDYTATQIVQKEELADVGNALTTLMHVLADFANDIRILYSSAIAEVTSRDSKERLGGSSADATKNNPVNWENIAGKAVVVESGMRILYAMISSDLQRDLRGSVQARYQPVPMMVQTYESFRRLCKALTQLSVNEDAMQRNLEEVRNKPSEAMVAILRGEQWVHSKYGVGHDFVKKIGGTAQKEKKPLMEVAMMDPEFMDLYGKLSIVKQAILSGEIEKYMGSAAERAQINIQYAREVIKKG